jgi:hypothetical protein
MAMAIMSTGEILLTVNAARRSDNATNTSVAAKTSAEARVRMPSDTASPEATIAAASPHAAHAGSAGT